MLQNLDTRLFDRRTAGPEGQAWLTSAASLIASAVAPVDALILLVAWVEGWSRPALLEPVRQKWTPVLTKDRRPRRSQSLSDASISVGEALDAVAAGLVALGIVRIIGALANRPRPFEIGLGLNLMNHAPESSFPPDHATLMFALAASLALLCLPTSDAKQPFLTKV